MEKQSQTILVTVHSDLSQVFKEAQTLLQDGVELELVFASGTYYCPSLSIDMSDCPEQARLVLTGYPNGQTILSGAQVLASVDWQDEGLGLFSCNWPGDGKLRADPWFPSKQAIGLRSEMLTINGRQFKPRDLEDYELNGFWNVETPQHQRTTLEHKLKLGLDPHLLVAGEFGIVAGADGQALRVYVRLGEAQEHHSNPCRKQVLVEAALNSRLLTFTNAHHLTCKNLTFTMCAGQPAEGFETPVKFLAKSRLVAFEHCNFVWNSGFGLNIEGLDDLSFESCAFNHNGYGGLGLGSINNLTINSCESSYNDWRNVWGGDFVNCHCTAGIKAHRVAKAVVSNHRSCANAVNGIWFDVYCSDVLVKDSLCLLNGREGLFFELSEGPFEAYNNLLLANGEHGLIVDVVGRSFCHHNLVVAINVDGLPGSTRGAVDFGQGLRYNEHSNQNMVPGLEHIFKDNLVFGTDGSGALMALHNRVLLRDQAADNAYQIFWHCFEFGNNSFQLASGANQTRAFVIEDSRTAVIKRFGIEQWQLTEFVGASDDRLTDVGLVDPQGFDCRRRDQLAQPSVMPFVKIDDELLSYCLTWYQCLGFELSYEGLSTFTSGRAHGLQFFGLEM